MPHTEPEVIEELSAEPVDTSASVSPRGSIDMHGIDLYSSDSEEHSDEHLDEDQEPSEEDLRQALLDHKRKSERERREREQLDKQQTDQEEGLTSELTQRYLSDHVLPGEADELSSMTSSEGDPRIQQLHRVQAPKEKVQYYKEKLIDFDRTEEKARQELNDLIEETALNFSEANRIKVEKKESVIALLTKRRRNMETLLSQAERQYDDSLQAAAFAFQHADEVQALIKRFAQQGKNRWCTPVRIPAFDKKVLGIVTWLQQLEQAVWNHLQDCLTPHELTEGMKPALQKHHEMLCKVTYEEYKGDTARWYTQYWSFAHRSASWEDTKRGVCEYMETEVVEFSVFDTIADKHVGSQRNLLTFLDVEIIPKTKQVYWTPANVAAISLYRALSGSGCHREAIELAKEWSKVDRLVRSEEKLREIVSALQQARRLTKPVKTPKPVVKSKHTAKPKFKKSKPGQRRERFFSSEKRPATLEPQSSTSSSTAPRMTSRPWDDQRVGQKRPFKGTRPSGKRTRFNKDNSEQYIEEQSTFTLRDLTYLEIDDYEPVSIASIPRNNHRSPFIVPIELGQQGTQAPVLMLIDSGADISCLDFHTAKKLDLEIKPCTDKLHGFDGKVEVYPKGQVTVQLECGDCKVQEWTMILIDLTIPDYKGVIAPDLAALLGAEFKLPNPNSYSKGIEKEEKTQPEAEPGLLSAEIDEIIQHLDRESSNAKMAEADPAHWADQRLMAEEFVSIDQRKRILDAIKSSLQRNAEIPTGTFCNVPESIVDLPTIDDEPVWRRQYDIPFHLRPLVSERIQQYLDENVIKRAPPGVQYQSPLMAAKKGENDIRLCFDARGLNRKLKDENFTIPRVRDLFEKLQGFSVCSRLDLRNSYNQLRVRESDQHKTAFMWDGVQYVWVGAPFGLKTLTAKFQRTMQHILRDLDHCVVVFVDDILVFSRSESEHIQDLIAVTNTLTMANLRLRWTKCEFGLQRVRLLGHVVSGSTIQADPKKISAFAKCEVPMTGKQMQSFLGAANYLRDYIPCYSQITAPLEPLRFAKDVRAEWNDECQRAFDRLKEVLSHSPVLSMPNFAKPFYIQTDASQAGVGAVLYQLDSEKKPKYISFVSSSLRKSQRNYPATKRELLGIVFALKSFRRWVYGGPKFTIYTDHAALQHLWNSKDTSQYMLINWSYILSEFQFDVIHRPGISLVLPDALSRLYDVMKQEHANFKPKVLEKSQKIPPKKPRKVAVITLNQDTSGTSLKWKTFLREVMEKRDPGSEKQRCVVLRKFHDMAHESTDGLFRRLFHAGYYWDGMRKACSNFTRQCEPCLMFNIGKKGYHPLTSIAAKYPGDHWAVDLAGPFPTSQRGHQHILVAVDIATRFVWLRPLQRDDAISVARKFYKISSEFGFPKIIQSDNGGAFVSEVIAEYKRICGFERRYVAPYHPRANGAAESHVKIMKTLLKKRITGDWSEWNTYLPALQHMLNQRIWHKSKSSPNSLMFARPFNALKDYGQVESRLLSEKTLRQMHADLVKIVYPSVSRSVQQANNKEARRFNQTHVMLSRQRFTAGSQVYMIDEAATSKLQPKWIGPFTIVEYVKPHSYRLKDWKGNVLPRLFPPSKLKSAESTRKEFEDVTAIIDHRGEVNNREYLAVTGEQQIQIWLPDNLLIHEQHHIVDYWDRRETGEDPDVALYQDCFDMDVQEQAIELSPHSSPGSIGTSTRETPAQQSLIDLSDYDSEESSIAQRTRVLGRRRNPNQRRHLNPDYVDPSTVVAEDEQRFIPRRRRRT